MFFYTLSCKDFLYLSICCIFVLTKMKQISYESKQIIETLEKELLELKQTNRKRNTK